MENQPQKCIGQQGKYQIDKNTNILLVLYLYFIVILLLFYCYSIVILLLFYCYSIVILFIILYFYLFIFLVCFPSVLTLRRDRSDVMVASISNVKNSRLLIDRNPARGVESGVSSNSIFISLIRTSGENHDFFEKSWDKFYDGCVAGDEERILSLKQCYS
jgi:hypothetical protein